PAPLLLDWCIPARPRVLILLLQQGQRSLRLNMGTGHEQRINGRNRSHVRSVKRRVCNGSGPVGITETRNWRLVTIRYAECRYSVFAGTKQRIHRRLQASPETDGDEQVLRTEEVYLLLQIAVGTGRSFGARTDAVQSIRHEVCELRRKIDAHHDNPPRM